MAPKINALLEQSMVAEPSVLLESEDVPIPDADDFVIEILTDHKVDFDEISSDGRKMTDEDQKLFRSAKEAELQSGLYHKVSNVANEKLPRSSYESSMGVDVEVHRQDQGTPQCLGISRPRLDRGSPRQHHNFCAG